MASLPVRIIRLACLAACRAAITRGVSGSLHAGLVLAACAAGAAGAATAADVSARNFATKVSVTTEALPEPVWREVWKPAAGPGWGEAWFLDGAAGRVVPTARGFELHAGAMETADAGHTVLWTRRSFEGDLRVDFRYTRLDAAGPGRNSVNILYFHAQGSGKGPHARDLQAWRDLRTVAAMRWYFEHMEAYHISFSAYSAADSKDQDYVRFRRYLPERGRGLADTEVLPTYHAPELFRTGVPHDFTLVRSGSHVRLVVRDTRTGAARTFAWDTSSMPPLEAGRIGIRHMAGRAALYEDFTVRFGAGR